MLTHLTLLKRAPALLALITAGTIALFSELQATNAQYFSLKIVKLANIYNNTFSEHSFFDDLYVFKKEDRCHFLHRDQSANTHFFKRINQLFSEKLYHTQGPIATRLKHLGFKPIKKLPKLKNALISWTTKDHTHFNKKFAKQLSCFLINCIQDDIHYEMIPHRKSIILIKINHDESCTLSCGTLCHYYR